MKKLLKLSMLVATLNSSLVANGQTDTILNISTAFTVILTLDTLSETISMDDTLTVKTVKTQKFIEENRESLEIEIAQGDGEKLDTLALLYGLKEKDTWKSQLQKNYEHLFYNKDKKQKSSFELSGELRLFAEKKF